MSVKIDKLKKIITLHNSLLEKARSYFDKTGAVFVDNIPLDYALQIFPYVYRYASREDDEAIQDEGHLHVYKLIEAEFSDIKNFKPKIEEAVKAICGEIPQIIMKNNKAEIHFPAVGKIGSATIYHNHASFRIGVEKLIQYLTGARDIRECFIDWGMPDKFLNISRKKTLLLSIGKTKNKKILLPIIKKISGGRFDIYSTKHTHEFLKLHQIKTSLVYKIKEVNKKPNLNELITRNYFDIIINIPTSTNRKNSEFSDGKFIRHEAASMGTTIATDIDVAQALLSKFYTKDLEEKARLQREVFANPLYNFRLSYEDNYREGPYGLFSSEHEYIPAPRQEYKFLGKNVNSVFGIPAGPILNSNFVKSSFDWGFDLVTYKTVRSVAVPSHKWPNIVFVKANEQITEEMLRTPITASEKTDDSPLNFSITNSFGVPSQSPDIWQPDVKKALEYQKNGQILILSVMGTKKEGYSEKDYFEDFGTTARLAKETGVSVIEVNLSCPNMNREGLICYDIERSRSICEAVRKVIGNTPLLIKIGYYEKEQQLLFEKFIGSIATVVDGIVAVNALHMMVIDETGKQVLPGEGRMRSGVCGASIRSAGVDLVKRLVKIKENNDYKFSVVGVGGVLTPDDYLMYIKAGADAVQSATGAMWNPYLAEQIKASEKI